MLFRSVPTFEAIPIPPPVLAHHLNVTICADLFFVQGIPFFHTISRGLGFRTVAHITDRSKEILLRELRSVIRLYRTRGYNVCDIHADHEFDCLRDDLRPLELNIVPPDSHVGEVERSVRTIKERLRSCIHGLPFTRVPKLFIRHLVADVVRCLNQFPWKNGVSDTLSPAALVTGHPSPDFHHMQLEFGAYVQVFEDNSPTNPPRARSLGAIALDPTGNAQGDYNFLSLATGAKISRHQWTELPITDTAIARVAALAIEDDQPLIQERGLVVEWRPDHPIDDSEYDRTYNPPTTAPADVFDNHLFDPIDDAEAADLAADAAAHVFNDAPPDPPDLAEQGAEPLEQQQHNEWIFDNEQPALVELDENNAYDADDTTD